MIAIDSLLCSQHRKNKEFTEVYVERGFTGDSYFGGNAVISCSLARFQGFDRFYGFLEF